MNGSNATLYYRYGAHELKARYQVNLLLSQMLVLLLIGVGMGVSGLLSGEGTFVIVPPRPVSSVSSKIGPPPTIIIRAPQTGAGARPPVDHAIIPVPVDDSSAEFETILSREDRASWLNSDSSTGTGDSSFSIDTSVTDFFPERDVFVPYDSLPVIIREIKPDYPSQAIQAGLEGRVTIQALVDKEGAVRDVFVVKPSGVECLDLAAVKAARQCTYRPAIQNGHPIAVWVTYPVVFRLK